MESDEEEANPADVPAPQVCTAEEEFLVELYPKLRKKPSKKKVLFTF